MGIKIHQGSILDVQADCIVNPANSFLRHGAGLAKVIADAAAPRRNQRNRQVGFTSYGPQEYLSEPALSEWRADRAWADEQRDAPLIATGNVFTTSAGRLPYRAIIHAVGPIWNGGDFCERSLLRSAHAEALNTAERLGFQSIAFPAISCGLFGFPVLVASGLAVAAVFGSRLDVTFALMEQEHVDYYRSALAVVGVHA